MTYQNKKKHADFIKSAFINISLLSFLLFPATKIVKVNAAESVEFNLDVLDINERDNLNISQFSKPGHLMTGVYSLSVKINGQPLTGDREIIYSTNKANPDETTPCLKQNLVNEFGIKDKYYSALNWSDSGCIDINALSGMVVTADLATSNLNISIPQEYLIYTANNWDPPSRWDNGIPGFLFDYNVNATARKDHNVSVSERSFDMSGNGTTGVNIGAWRFRADWQANLSRRKGNSANQDFDFSQIYLYRPLPSIQAKLTLGETTYQSSIFDSFRYVGGMLESDDSMLPPNLRNYAPEIAGVAKTNAKITVTQQGRVLYQTQVAPGPFRIQDLSDSVSGELLVKVEENNGEVREFSINTSSIPYLTRPGMLRYKVMMGVPEGYHYRDNDNKNTIDYHDTDSAPLFSSGEFSWGINSGWSLYGGAVVSNDYQSLALGLGRDLLAFGAISVDATSSWADISRLGEDTITGTSYQISYSKEFDEYDSQITFAGYRFSQREFMTVRDFMDIRSGQNNKDNEKQMYTITMNKYFTDLGLNLYVNYSHRTYWNAVDNDNYNASAAKTFDVFNFKNVTASLVAFKNRYNNSNDYGGYLNFNVPLNSNDSLTIGFNTSKNFQEASLGYNKKVDDNNSYQIAASFNDSDSSFRGNYSYLGDQLETNVNATVEPQGTTAIGASIRGGLTVTTKGVVLHRVTLPGATRMLIDANGVSGIPIDTTNGITKTNMFGDAVIADQNNYYRTFTSVVIDQLDDDVEVIDPVIQSTLTEGAIGYRKLHVISGGKAMAIIRLSDGTYPPFGAMVENKNNQQTGIVGEEGYTYISGINDSESMEVKWEDKSCSISFPEKLPHLDSPLLLPCTLSH
jgi:outer membrane usher protein FimD/PapC